MIQLKLRNDAVNALFFDDIRGGRAAFHPQNDAMVAEVSRDEFTNFLKSNNLIPYHNQLKGYEDGTYVGEFNSD